MPINLALIRKLIKVKRIPSLKILRVRLLTPTIYTKLTIALHKKKQGRATTNKVAQYVPNYTKTLKTKMPKTNQKENCVRKFSHKIHFLAVEINLFSIYIYIYSSNHFPCKIIFFSFRKKTTWKI